MENFCIVEKSVLIFHMNCFVTAHWTRTACLFRMFCVSFQSQTISLNPSEVKVKITKEKLSSSFSILCLTTDLIHQGHERRKKNKSTAQHVRAATRSIKCERQWRHFALATDGLTLLANNMAAYPLRISNSVCPLLISSTCLISVHTIYNHVKSIICYLCFMQHAWSC